MVDQHGCAWLERRAVEGCRVQQSVAGIHRRAANCWQGRPLKACLWPRRRHALGESKASNLLGSPLCGLSLPISFPFNRPRSFLTLAQLLLLPQCVHVVWVHLVFLSRVTSCPAAYLAEHCLLALSVEVETGIYPPPRSLVASLNAVRERCSSLTFGLNRLSLPLDRRPPLIADPPGSNSCG